MSLSTCYFHHPLPNTTHPLEILFAPLVIPSPINFLTSLIAYSNSTGSSMFFFLFKYFVEFNLSSKRVEGRDKLRNICVMLVAKTQLPVAVSATHIQTA